MHDIYDLVIASLLKSHVSNSIINILCIQYGDIPCMAYYFQVRLMRMSVLILPV